MQASQVWNHKNQDYSQVLNSYNNLLFIPMQQHPWGALAHCYEGSKFPIYLDIQT